MKTLNWTYGLIIGTIDLDGGHTGLLYGEGATIKCCDLVTGEIEDTQVPSGNPIENAKASWVDPEWNLKIFEDVADIMTALDRAGVESDQFLDYETTVWRLPCGRLVIISNDEILDECGKVEYSNDTWIERTCEGDVVFHGGRDGNTIYEVGVEEWVAALKDPESLAYLEEGL